MLLTRNQLTAPLAAESFYHIPQIRDATKGVDDSDLYGIGFPFDLQ